MAWYNPGSWFTPDEADVQYAQGYVDDFGPAQTPPPTLATTRASSTTPGFDWSGLFKVVGGLGAVGYSVYQQEANRELLAEQRKNPALVQNSGRLGSTPSMFMPFGGGSSGGGGFLTLGGSGGGGMSPMMLAILGGSLLLVLVFSMGRR